MKIIPEGQLYQISGELAILINNLVITVNDQEPLKALLLAGQIKQYLEENNAFDEII